MSSCSAGINALIAAALFEQLTFSLKGLGFARLSVFLWVLVVVGF